MKKRYFVIAALAALLLLALILGTVACSAGGQEQPDKTIDILATVEPTFSGETEPTEPLAESTEATKAPTEPETTEAPTEPEATEAPAKAPSTGSSQSKPGSGTQSGSSQSKPGSSTQSGSTQNNSTQETPSGGQSSSPVETVPPATEPPAVQPPATEPPATEPPATPTEPAGCLHDWQMVYHEEVGHKVWWVTCACGARFATESEWWSHVMSYEGAEQILSHGSWGETSDYIIDTPAYTEWVCSKCGAVTNTQP